MEKHKFISSGNGYGSVICARYTPSTRSFCNRFEGDPIHDVKSVAPKHDGSEHYYAESFGLKVGPKETREEKADRFKQESGKEFHTSDCSTSIAPAEEPGPCDCDADDPAIGWINMVMGWARINHLESDAVISALCHAKDFVIDYKARIRELEQQLNKFQNTVWSEQADVQESVLQKFDVRNKMALLEQQLEERDAVIADWKSKYEGAKIAFNSACNAEAGMSAYSGQVDVMINHANRLYTLANSETEKKG